MNGATRPVLEEVITRLKDGNHLTNGKKGNLLAVTRFFAGMVFTSANDRLWLRRKFAMFDDFLWENSWTYRETIEEGRMKGLAEGLAEGLTAMRQSIETMAQTRFPDLLASIKSQITRQNDLAKLQELLIIVGTARTEGEVEQSLLALQ
jgi:hypothetical protein